MISYLGEQPDNRVGMIRRGGLLLVKLLNDEGCHGSGAAGKVSLQTPTQLTHAAVARHDQLFREGNII